MKSYNWETVKLTKHKHSMSDMWFYGVAKKMGFDFDNPINMFDGGPLWGYCYQLKDTCVYIRNVQGNVSIHLDDNFYLFNENHKSFIIDSKEHELYRDIKYSNKDEYDNYIEEYTLSDSDFQGYVGDLMGLIRETLEDSLKNYTDMIHSLVEKY